MAGTVLASLPAVLGLRRSRPRHMSRTRYYMGRFVARYLAHRTTLHADCPLLDAVQGFIRTLPASQHGLARVALRQHLGVAALDWTQVKLARYHRNVGALAAGVFGAEQVARLRAVADPRELAMIGSLMTLRRAEAAAMRWTSINLRTGMVLVPNGKGGKSAFTLLTPQAQVDIQAWFEAAGEPSDESPVFPGPRGHPYKAPSLGLIVQKLLTRAGLWARGMGNCHRFRRSLATAYLKVNPGDLVGLQAILRHENVATTARYAWLTSDDLAPRLARVNL